MRMERILGQGMGAAVVYAAAAAVAVGLKYLYSRASCADLDWILGPTASLVTWITGLPFVPDPAAGYVNGALGIAIAPACSGVNFLIIAYAMAFFSFAHRFRSGLGKGGWMGVALAGAYGMTLAVNSVRICLSIATISRNLEFGWLTPERIHRVEGVGVYFFFLCLFYQGLCHMTSRHDPGRSVNRSVPLLWYLAVALVVPILTGNYRDQQGRFVEHGVMVLVSCAGVLGAMGGLRRLLLPIAVRCGIKQSMTTTKHAQG